MASDIKKASAKAAAKNNNNNNLDCIPEQREDGDEEDYEQMMLKAKMIDSEKPSYFNMFDEEIIDSEEDMVAGENNYIEIKCM